MSLQEITERELSVCGVVSLPTRPGASREFGGRSYTPAQVKESLARDLYRLYQLIWKRFVASRMQSAKYETVSVKLDAGKYRFTASASKLVFDGFMSMYVLEDEENEIVAVMDKNLSFGFTARYSFNKDTPCSK